MLLRKCIALIIIIFFVAIPIVSNATNLRGRVYARNQFTISPYPIGGVAVDLYIQKGGLWQHVARYITGADGMYFFQNIFPENYVLQINNRQNFPITVQNQLHQDLPPIIIQY